MATPAPLPQRETTRRCEVRSRCRRGPRRQKWSGAPPHPLSGGRPFQVSNMAPKFQVSSLAPKFQSFKFRVWLPSFVPRFQGVSKFQVTGGETRSREQNTKRWKPGAKHETLEAGSKTRNAGNREQNTKRWKPGAKHEALEAGSGNAEIALMGHYSFWLTILAEFRPAPITLA